MLQKQNKYLGMRETSHNDTVFINCFWYNILNSIDKNLNKFSKYHLNSDKKWQNFHNVSIGHTCLVCTVFNIFNKQKALSVEIEDLKLNIQDQGKNDDILCFN